MFDEGHASTARIGQSRPLHVVDQVAGRRGEKMDALRHGIRSAQKAAANEAAVERRRPTTRRHDGAVAKSVAGLGGEEIDGLSRRDRFDVARLEAEQAYALNESALEFRIVELARHDLAERDFAGRRDRKAQYELAL